MTDTKKNLTILVSVVVIAIAAWLVLPAAYRARVLTFLHLSSPQVSTNGAVSLAKTAAELRAGPDTFQTLEATGKYPQIIQATIDPLVAQVGNRQTISLVVSDPDGIVSVEAEIRTDHSTTTLPLSYVRAVADSEIKPTIHSVDQNTRSAVNQKLNAETASGAKSQPLVSLISQVPVTKIPSGQKLLYSAAWTTQDINNVKYQITFVVKNQKGGVNSIIFKNPKPLLQNNIQQKTAAALPSGSQTYQIVEAAGKEPQIIQATINPPDVHVGRKQTLSIVVSDPNDIASAEAQIQTDHATTTLPLNYVRAVADSEIPPSAYSVDANGKLAINEKLRDEQLAEKNGANSALSSAILSSVILSSVIPSAPPSFRALARNLISGVRSEILLSAPPSFRALARNLISGVRSGILRFVHDDVISVTKASPGQKLLYSGEWIVKDTHDTKYHTTFVVKDVKGNVNSITLAWSDACGIPNSGSWALGSNGTNCTISSVDGVDNGSATINYYTLTLNSTFAFNSGQNISIISGGKIAIGFGGKILKTNLWLQDGDSDGWPGTNEAAQATVPAGTGWQRRYLWGTTPTDCDDGNSRVHQNVSTYNDFDADGWVGPGGVNCVGNSANQNYIFGCISPVSYTTCTAYIGNATVYYTVNGAGSYANDYTSIDSTCQGTEASNPDNNDFNQAGACPY